MAFSRQGSPEKITKVLNSDKKIVVGSKLTSEQEELTEQENIENELKNKSNVKDNTMNK